MIIFLHGPDTFRSRQKLKELKDKFVRDIDKSRMNLEILDGSDLETPEFEKAISTPPFLAKKRMVVIENLISKNKGQKIQKEILTVLEKIDSEEVIVIFWEEELNKTKSKKRSKTTTRRSNLLLERLKKEKYVQEFLLLEPFEVKKWAESEIKKRKGIIDPGALNLLTDVVGNDLWQLDTEIDKLLAYTKNKSIKIEDVKNLVKNKIDDDIFKLTDALGQKNKSLALKLISNQLKNGTSSVELLSKITWQFRNLLIIKSFVESNGEGYSSDRLIYQLGLHPFVIKKTLGQARNYDLNNLKNIYSQLLKMDFKIKTSQVDPEVLFDLLIIKA